MLDAQKVLKSKNEELNQFAHTMAAHDLKEPLKVNAGICSFNY